MRALPIDLDAEIRAIARPHPYVVTLHDWGHHERWRQVLRRPPGAAQAVGTHSRDRQIVHDELIAALHMSGDYR